eukprot:scaffold3791_cov390-Prasinococcus_capsulatus_cf.AAC.10
MKTLHAFAKPMKDEITTHLKSRGVQGWNMKIVKRTYASERNDIPRCPQYVLKVSYSFKHRALPQDLSGEHFHAILGTQTSALELLLLKRGIMGPSWLILNNAAKPSASFSWCSMEYSVQGKKAIDKDMTGKDPPPLVVAAINLKTIIDHKNNTNEIAAASILFAKPVKIDAPMQRSDWNVPDLSGNGHGLVEVAVVRKIGNSAFPPGFDRAVQQRNGGKQGKVVEQCANERALLNYILVKLKQMDPDVLVGHNFAGFDLGVLLHRLQELKVMGWSRIGRLRRNQFPKLGGGGGQWGGGASAGAMSTLAGRVMCDTYLSAKEFLREVSYSLKALAENQLKETRVEMSPHDIVEKYNSAPGLLELMGNATRDAWLTLCLMFHMSVLPLTRQLSNVSGNLWGKTLQGQRAQRIEYLLLHEFHDRKFLCPDKYAISKKDRASLSHDEDGEEEKSGKKKGPAYSGGLVLEPKKGLYDKYVLLLDFNSLYPSIIQEYNICFSTTQRPEDGTIPPLPDASLEAGLLPTTIKRLVQRRRQVKQMLKTEKNPLKRQQLDIRQQALKLTANSMYGCLGFSSSRFYARPLAELITAQGREILQSTVDLVQGNLGLQVIYGDTDSIMINTNTDDLVEVRRLGTLVKNEVNKRYKLLEIEMDGIYQRMLLLKKKKYAALKVEFDPSGNILTEMEQKGLDIVRRDWCPLSKEVGNFVLSEILSGKSRDDVVLEIHNRLQQVRDDLANDKIPIGKFVITKTLTKAPEEYADAKGQPHVQVALRRKKEKARDGISAGETVPYIIAIEMDKENAAGGLAERARHLQEMLKNKDKFKVDKEYYLAQQVHPVVARLCAPIEGTDASRLADCLGLDPARFRGQVVQQTSGDDQLLSSAAFLDDEDRFKTCNPLVLSVPGENGVSRTFQFPGIQPVAQGKMSMKEALSPPIKDGETVDLPQVSTAALANQALLQARLQISDYYDGVIACDDEMWNLETRNISLRSDTELPAGHVPLNYPRCQV